MKDHIKDMIIKPNAKSYPLICLHSMYKRSTKNKKQHSWKQRQNLYSLYWTADSKVSVALCFSVLGRVPFSITSRILKPWALELGISVPRSGISARLALFHGSFFFPQTWTQWITQHGKDVVRRERRSEWHQDGQKKGWQCTECIAMWGQKMPQTDKPLRISNHVKSI